MCLPTLCIWIAFHKNSNMPVMCLVLAMHISCKLMRFWKSHHTIAQYALRFFFTNILENLLQFKCHKQRCRGTEFTDIKRNSYHTHHLNWKQKTSSTMYMVMDIVVDAHKAFVITTNYFKNKLQLNSEFHKMRLKNMLQFFVNLLKFTL